MKDKKPHRMSECETCLENDYPWFQDTLPKMVETFRKSYSEAMGVLHPEEIKYIQDFLDGINIDQMAVLIDYLIATVDDYIKHRIDVISSSIRLSKILSEDNKVSMLSDSSTIIEEGHRDGSSLN